MGHFCRITANTGLILFFPNLKYIVIDRISIVERSVRIWQMCSADFQEYAVIIIPIRRFFCQFCYDRQSGGVQDGRDLWKAVCTCG